MAVHDYILTAVLAIFLISEGDMTQAETDFAGEYRTIKEQQETMPDDARLKQLFETHWAQSMYDAPEYATYLGFPGQNHRWADRTEVAIEREKELTDLKLKALESFDRESLSVENRLNYDLFRRVLDDRVDSYRFPGELLPISQMNGPQQDLATVLNDMPTNTAAEWDDILARLAAVPAVLEQTVTLMKRGLEAGVTPPRVTMRDVPQQVLNQISGDPAAAPMLRPLESLPSSFSEAERERIRDQATAVYSKMIKPALESLHRFLVDTYLPGCRTSIAWSDLPEGPDWYAYLVKHYITTDMTPDEIFDTGKAEVARLRAAMDEVIRSAKFEGSYQDWCEFLRTDPQFFFDDAESLVREYRDISKRVDPELVKMFGHLPRLPYGVIVIPDYAAKSQTTAYYQPGSFEAGRPGYFYVNTYNLKSRPKWEMEPLSLHEAVPGHHLQISIAQELEDIPDFRRHSWFTAYGEGWALYSEALGEQMGFYTTPYSKYGQLSYQMWRAIRLVVDVGMHYKGWSRQQAIDYFMENSCKVEHDVTVEIDRYIVWPGQSLAYKIGELKILELRAFAEEKLGERFDLRAFHDMLLGAGTMPLDILEARIRDWVAQRTRQVDGSVGTAGLTRQ